MTTAESLSISIITPTFNRAKLLPRLAQSLWNQQNYLFEWIVIDDGSTDGTKSFINTFAKDSLFNVIYKFHQNRGMLHSINIGMSLVSGKYFFKLDSDDYLLRFLHY